jgi:hypothetical protein
MVLACPAGPAATGCTCLTRSRQARCAATARSRLENLTACTVAVFSVKSNTVVGIQLWDLRCCGRFLTSAERPLGPSVSEAATALARPGVVPRPELWATASSAHRLALRHRGPQRRDGRRARLAERPTRPASSHGYPAEAADWSNGRAGHRGSPAARPSAAGSRTKHEAGRDGPTAVRNLLVCPKWLHCRSSPRPRP